jgi:hypothetical protein
MTNFNSTGTMDEENTAASLRLVWQRSLPAATVVGLLGVIVGYFGPLIYSNSNLGPLLGIFITGPGGFLFGAMIGIVRSAYLKDTGLKGETLLLALIWGLVLLDYIAFANLGGLLLLPTVILQFLVLMVDYMLLAIGARKKQVSSIAHYRRLVFSGLLTAFTVMNVVPPIIATGEPPRIDTHFAPFWDSRFDASHHVSGVAVDIRQLLLQWGIAMAAAAILNIVIALKAKKGANPR